MDEQAILSAGDIRDIIGPLALPLNKWMYILAAGILVLALLVFLFMFFVKKRRVIKSVTFIKRPAHEIAYESLEELKRRQYWEKGEFKSYYIALSDIVRKYIENRFELRAPEMTTEEFLNAAKNEKFFLYEHASLLGDFLVHCDLVKFAKYHPQQKEADLSFESAKKIIDQTKEISE